MKVLVTGANGFLGRHVVATLLRSGHSVRALVRQSADITTLGWPTAVEVIRTDLIGTASLQPACAGVDAVMHLAADLRGGDAQQLVVAVDGTRRLIDAIDPGSTRLLLASSFSVYDWSRVAGTLSEDSPLLDQVSMLPLDGYARAKLQQERFARAACASRALSLTVLRPAAIWGAENPVPSDVGPRAGPLRFVVAPERRLRLTYIENCASAFVAALDPRAAGRTFNIDDGFDITAWEFTGRASGLAGGRSIRVPVPQAAAASLCRVGAAMARRVLGKRKIPGLLIAERFGARFHAARAGHEALTATLGWTPPFGLEECLARAASNRAQSTITTARGA